MAETAGFDRDWERVYRNHVESVRALVSRRLSDAAMIDDVVQETFARVLAAATRLDGTVDLGPYIRTVARNLCRNTADEKRRLAMFLESRAMHASEVWADAVDDVVNHVALDTLCRLGSVPRRLLFLREVERWTVAELAEHEGLTSDGVRSALRRGRSRLRALYASVTSNEEGE